MRTTHDGSENCDRRVGITVPRRLGQSNDGRPEAGIPHLTLFAASDGDTGRRFHDVLPAPLDAAIQREIMESIRAILEQQPLTSFFLTIAIGYDIGGISV